MRLKREKRVNSINMNQFFANPPPPVPIGLPALCKMAFDGLDLAPVWNDLVLRVQAQPDDAAALLDLSTIAQLQGRPQDRFRACLHARVSHVAPDYPVLPIQMGRRLQR